MPSTKQIKGDRFERLAETVLIREGYRILERNFRGGGGEIDRIAEDGETLVFVEIRARADAEQGAPMETVRPVKQRRVVLAALAWLAARGTMREEIRFDVVSVVFGGPVPDVLLVKDAFDAEVLEWSGLASFL